MANQPLRSNRLARMIDLRRNAFALGGPLGLLLTHSMDMIIRVIRNGMEDEASIGYALESLTSERTLAMNWDSDSNDPTRQVVYGFTEAVGILVDSLLEDRREGRGVEEAEAERDDSESTCSDLPNFHFIVPKAEPADEITLQDDEPSWSGQVQSTGQIEQLQTASFGQKRRASAVEDEIEQIPPTKRRCTSDIATVSATAAEDGSFACDKCSKSFDSLLNLQKHVFVHNVSPRPRPFACPHCPERHLKLSLLNSHLRKQHNINPYGCAQCEKTYAMKAELVAHWKESEHEGEKAHVQPSMNE